MVFFILMFIGLLWGYYIKYFNKNNIKKQSYFQIHKSWLLYLFIIIQIGFRILSIFYNLEFILVFIEIFALILSLLFIYYNRKEISILIIEIGFILNSIVMICNDGMMPVIYTYGLLLDIRHSLINNTTNLIFLSDIIRLPLFLSYMAYLYSIGDLIIAIGIMFLIKDIICNERIIKK